MKNHAELFSTLYHSMAGPLPAGPQAIYPREIQSLSAPRGFFWEPSCAVVVLTALLLMTIMPVARAQPNAELNARDRIVTTVIGQGARAPRLKQAKAQLAQ